jgi:hypothetical protein
VDRSAEGLPVTRAEIRTCLQAALGFIGQRATGKPPIGFLLAALLARLPLPEDVLVTAGDLAQAGNDPTIRLASDLAIDSMLNGSKAVISDQPDLGAAAVDLQRVLILLDTLERPGPASRPSRKASITALRQTLDAAGRQRFQAEMAKCLDAATALQTAGTAQPDTTGLEANLRDLRRFESVGRNFGGALVYDLTIAAAVLKLAQHPPNPANSNEIARLIEILNGPEAAIEFLLRARSA